MTGIVFLPGSSWAHSIVFVDHLFTLILIVHMAKPLQTPIFQLACNTPILHQVTTALVLSSRVSCMFYLVKYNSPVPCFVLYIICKWPQFSAIRYDVFTYIMEENLSNSLLVLIGISYNS